MLKFQRSELWGLRMKKRGCWTRSVLLSVILIEAKPRLENENNTNATLNFEKGSLRWNWRGHLHRACIKWRAFLDTLVGFGNGNTVNTRCFWKRLAESLQWQIFPFVLIFFRCRHLKNPEIRSRIQKLYEAGILQIRWEIQQNSREFVGKPQRFAHCYTICAKVLCFFPVRRLHVLWLKISDHVGV